MIGLARLLPVVSLGLTDALLGLATVATHFGVWPNDISRLERGLKRNDTLAADYRHWLSAA